MSTTVIDGFHWRCQHTWKNSSYNTMWCLIGCCIGDFGTILFFQINNINWSTLSIMVLAIINGLITSTILETELKSELEKTSTISNAKKSFEEHDKFTEKERDNLLKILNTYVDKIEKKTWTTHDFI